MQKTRTQLVQERERIHSLLVKRVINDQLIRHLTPFYQEKPSIIRQWAEPLFTSQGIYKSKVDAYGETLASPDVLAVTLGPKNYLIALELKSTHTRSCIEEMENQVERYGIYLEENPEQLYTFLHDEGIHDRIIESLHIFCAGAVSSNGAGIREIRCKQIF